MRTLFLYDFKKECPWIGDLCSLEVLTKGLRQLGHDTDISNDINEIDYYDHIVLSNICNDLNPYQKILNVKNRSFSLIPFQEDYLLYSSACKSFHAFVANALTTDNPEEAISFLEYMPDIIHYEQFAPKRDSLNNQPVMATADVCIANSHLEEKMIKRYCPMAKTKTIYWTSGYADKTDYPINSTFTDRFDLKHNDYLLQIGRISPRKNQLATILATRNLNVPLVIVATGHFPLEDGYLQTCIEAAKKLRSSKTLFLTNAAPEGKFDKVEIKNVPGGLKKNELISAYQNATVLCHPAFYELPGYVYLEAAKLGLPSVATEWSTLKDYFTDSISKVYTLDNRIEYVLPYDLKAIRYAVQIQSERSFVTSKHEIFSRTEKDVANEFLDAILES